MMRLIRRAFFARTEPIHHLNVPPADRDEEKEAEIDAVKTSAFLAIKRAERRSWEIRQELAGNVLKLVAGD